MLRRLETTYEVARGFAQLKDKIAALTLEADDLQGAILSAEAPAALEHRLEGLLDRCDALADELDTYESHGLGELESAYERLLAKVEEIRERLDGGA